MTFISLNADSPSNRKLVEFFGVDAIPHVAFVDKDHIVRTALVGKARKEWIEGNIDSLRTRNEVDFQMYDAFAENRNNDLRKFLDQPGE